MSSKADDLEARLRSRDWKVRRDAVEDLRANPGSSDERLLAEMLYDENLAVVDAVAAALLHSEKPESFELLLRALNAEEPNDDVAGQVANVLRNGPSAWFAKASLTALQKSPDPEVRRFAADVLGDPLYERGAIPALEHALEDTDEGVRLAAADSLQRLRS